MLLRYLVWTVALLVLGVLAFDAAEGPIQWVVAGLVATGVAVAVALYVRARRREREDGHVSHASAPRAH